MALLRLDGTILRRNGELAHHADCCNCCDPCPEECTSSPDTLSFTIYNDCTGGVNNSFTDLALEVTGVCSRRWTDGTTATIITQRNEATCQTTVSAFKGTNLGVGQGCVFASNCKYEDVFDDPDSAILCDPTGLELAKDGNCGPLTAHVVIG